MYRLKQLTILAGDLLGLYIGLYLAVTARYLSIPKAEIIGSLLAPFTWLFFSAVIIIFILGLYDLGRAKNQWGFFQKIITSAILWVVIGVFYFYIYGQDKINPKTILLLLAVFGFSLIALWRFVYNRFIVANILKTKIAFIGCSKEARLIIETLQNKPQIGYEVVGIIGDCYENPKLQNLTIKNLSGLKKNPDIIVLDFNYQKDEQLIKELYQNIFRQIGIIELADFYETIYHRLPPFTFSEGWFLTKFQEQSKKIYDRFSLLINCLSAVLIGIFFIIILPLVALAIKTTSNGPVLFKQARVGRGGKTFFIYKFRTMRALSADGSAEVNGAQYAASNDRRITKVGKFLRASRLDEIPQFINILKNEMSLIGPRPERPEFVEQLNKLMPFYSLRHLIKPGLTGWAQLQRGYYGTLDENLNKLEYDLYYIKNRGPLLDITIILKTISIVLGMIGR